jgi:hypothetical protein
LIPSGASSRAAARVNMRTDRVARSLATLGSAGTAPAGRGGRGRGFLRVPRRRILEDVAVSERDREHFRRLGIYKAASHAEVEAAHLSLPFAERLRRSWSLFLAHRASFRGEPDDPTPFYDRARALGLYKP